MKKFIIPFLLLFASAFGAVAINDINGLSQVTKATTPIASAPVSVPGQSAVTSGSLPSFQEAIGFGLTDSPTFTGLTLSGLTNTRVVLAGASGVLGGDADLTFSGTRTTATDLTVTNFPTFSAGTATRVPFFSTAGLLADSSALTYNSGTGTLSATTFIGSLTGNASTATALQTARAIYGNNFDGTAALTQIIASAFGGTGNGFTKFSGPTTAEKTFTLPDASSTLLYAGGPLGTPSSGTATNLTGTSGITGLGVVNSGSITSGFGSIDIGSDSLTAGAISGTTLASSGNYTLTRTSGNAPTISLVQSGINTWTLRQVATTGTFALETGGTDYMAMANNGSTVFSGGLNSTVIGATTPAAGSFTTLAATQYIKESTDTRNGPGAVSVTATTTKVTTTGVLDALSLADGVDGQVKRIVHDVDGGSFVLTPTTKTGWSTFTSTVVGETISLQFVTTRGWMVIGSYLGTIAP